MEGEQLNDGAPTTPRLAASLILLRDARPGLQLLMVRRNPEQRFMGGYWVFPGGAVDAHDGDGEAGRRAAAVRELCEEAAIAGVDSAELVGYSRWITPERLAIRFDTHFFLARAPASADGRCDGSECVDLRWDEPRTVLGAHARGERALALPTRRQLEQLSAFATVDELLRHARAGEVLPVRPQAVSDGEVARLVLPGDEATPRP